MMMTPTFTNMIAYAQGSCAVSACSDMNSIILSLDAGILLASIICQLLHMPEHDVPFPLPALVRTTTATAARGSAIRRSLFFS